MKVKMMISPYPGKLETEINDFIKDINVIGLQVNTTSDNGYLDHTAIIMYEDGE